MRILHTSDWHLGRIFHGIHLTEDQAHILDQFITLVHDTKPDVILVAGDIFDRSVPPTEAVNLLDEVVSKILIDEGVPIMMIAGNHDSPDRLGFGYRLLEERGLNISGKLKIDRKPVILHDAYGPVYFYAIPYAEPALVREHFPGQSIQGHEEAMGSIIQHIHGHRPQNIRNVLMAHAFVAGGEESESERPLSVGGSSVVRADYFKDFHYVALGHLHRPQKAGEEHIRYSGSLMKYSFSEAAHKKAVNFIEMDEKGDIRIEYISLKPKRDLRCVEGYLQDLLKAGEQDNNREDYLKVTLLDEGAILDAIGKLRKVYPNVLHIERPQLTSNNQLVSADKDFRKMNELHLFASFLGQVTDREITEEQQKAFQQVLDQYYRMMREG
ncbi:Exodeoxyribonuclease I subunit D [Geosporobacter subterraneus DSM 17957]|uniref:Nuclease SbcCD subunit D n=1 Tax=Geosporobacter subterraneus DSM 17957 TaxID=1121919 RepID=A0A1M6D4J6_9FIRM|nr:exonuclease SbcCD subunit D [Geosporobacter subterraneus]SHI68170.1 Exodeoxyribonuclease I subunit D [Geosporobacter subterraneus DSM 17957]